MQVDIFVTEHNRTRHYVVPDVYAFRFANVLMYIHPYWDRIRVVFDEQGRAFQWVAERH